MIVLASADHDRPIRMNDLAMTWIGKALFLAGLISTNHPNFVFGAARRLVQLVLLVGRRVGDMEQNFRSLQRKNACSFRNARITADKHADFSDRRVEDWIPCRSL